MNYRNLFGRALQPGQVLPIMPAIEIYRLPLRRRILRALRKALNLNH